MQRLSDERGAVSTMVALLIVPLLGLAAITIDVAGAWAERLQLQVGADAGALAIAQDCGRGACGNPTATAQSFAVANNGNGAATATLSNPALTPSTGTVTVTTAGVRTHFFAPILGNNETSLSARATAGWGAPNGGTAVLPIALSWCEFLAQTGGGLPSGTTVRTIYFTKSSGTSCTGPSGNSVPGGFGWIKADAGSCKATSSLDQTVYSDTGESAPTSCTTADFVNVQNRTVLIPLYDKAGESGTNAWYHIYGYAAFTVTGYHFVGQYSWNGGTDCKGSDRCIKGYFTKFVDLNEAFTYSASAPKLGASIVSLTS